MAFALFGKGLLPEWVLPPGRGSHLASLHYLFVSTLSIINSLLLAFFVLCELSKQIIQRLVSILLNQLDHALELLVSNTLVWTPKTYIRHDGLPLAIPNISEWHFCTFMFIDAQFRVIHVGDIFQWDCRTC